MTKESLLAMLAAFTRAQFSGESPRLLIAETPDGILLLQHDGEWHLLIQVRNARVVVTE